MSKQQGNLEIPAKGAISDAPGYRDQDAPRAPSNADRVAEIRQRTAEAKSGLSAYQKRALANWWACYHGEPSGADVTPDEMAAKYLSAPPQWSRHSPIGWLAVKGIVSVIRDGELRYLDTHKEHVIGVDVSEDDARRLLEAKVAVLLPSYTVRVIAPIWPKRVGPPIAQGVRGELMHMRGNATRMDRDERFLEQALELGEVDIIQLDGCYTGPLSDLGQCPTPTPRDPKGRIYLNNYTPATSPEVARFAKPSERHVYPPTPRTIDCLIPEPPKGPQSQDWCSTPLVRCKANATQVFAEHFHLKDQEEITLYEWVAIMGSVRKTRHNEPVLDIIGELSEPGREFKAGVTTFLESHPGALSDAEGFPVFGFATPA